MVYKKLSKEDKIIIKYLRQKFGYGAKRIIKDHPEKNSGLRNVGYLLKKVDETGDAKRREESGRPKSSRTENNINAVKQVISSQEDKSGTHATPNEISKMMDIPRTSIRRIFAEDFKSCSLSRKSKANESTLGLKRSVLNDAQTFSVFLRNKS